MSLVLASRSPRRRELLALFGLPFSVCEADIDESPLDHETPTAMTERLALSKSEFVCHQLANSSFVLGGDTTVELDGEPLGKPVDRKEAASMLDRLSGRRHTVISAVALLGPGSRSTAVSRTDVDFVELTAGEIDRYCDSGEPYDKAGGYGIQGVAGTFVRQIHGSYSGVVGLPLFETRLLLTRAGLL